MRSLARRLKLKFVLPVLLLAALGATYKLVLAKPRAEAKPRVEGQVYVLPKEFLVNLSGDRFAKLNVALVLHGHDQVEAAEPGAAPLAEGFGPLHQEPVVRDVVTDALTGASADQLIDRGARDALKDRIARSIDARTDVEVDAVLFTDVAVQ